MSTGAGARGAGGKDDGLRFFPKDEVSGYLKQDVWARCEGLYTGISGPKSWIAGVQSS